MNRTEMIKAGFTGTKTYKHPETGEDIVNDWDDSERGCLLTSEEARYVFKGEDHGQLPHYPGDEFEDLEFLKEHGVDIDKLMNKDYE